MNINVEGLSVCLVLLFTAVCGLQDLKSREISINTYWSFGIIGMVLWFSGEQSLGNLIMALLPGTGLWFLSRLTKEAVGEGDALYYIVAALYLPAGMIYLLLTGSLLLCGASAVLIVLKCVLCGKNIRQETLPYIAYIFPVLCALVYWRSRT